MINNVHFDEGDFELDSEKVYYEFYFADNYAWDSNSLSQLRDTYNIYFMTSGDGAVPVKVCDCCKSIAFGNEDDGVISFQKWENGDYTHCIGIDYIDYLISDLKNLKL